MLALVYLHAQSKPDAVGDVQPVEGLTAKLGQTSYCMSAGSVPPRAYRLIIILMSLTF